MLTFSSTFSWDFSRILMFIFEKRPYFPMECINSHLASYLINDDSNALTFYIDNSTKE